MENLLEKLLEMEKEQQLDSAAGGDQPRRGPGGGARSEGAGEGRPLQQTLSHRHPHANRQVMLFYRANCQLSAVVLEYHSPQGAEVAVPAPPPGQVRVRGLHAGTRQDGLGGLECGHLAAVQDRVQVYSVANIAASIDELDNAK